MSVTETMRPPRWDVMQGAAGSADDIAFQETAADPTPPLAAGRGASASPAQHGDDQPPAEVPGYAIVRFLGRGAYGAVFLAQQENTGKQVAIKFYTQADRLDIGELKREVRILAALYATREIVQLIEVGWESSPPYFVMEYLEHGSLDARLQRQPLAPQEALRIFVAIAQALAQAHSRGILHCDLKPANVLLDGQLRPRLADFGQSRLPGELSPSLGTFFYMAPEQAQLDAVPDARWDVYALGALLFAMLTGEPPHKTAESRSALKAGRSLSERLLSYQALLRAAPPPAVALRQAQIETGLREIVSRCLALNPDERYGSIEAVLEAVEARAARRARWPLLVLGAVGPALLLILMAGVSWQAAQTARNTSTAAITQRALEGCRFAARFVAEAASREIDHRWNELEEVAADEGLRSSLRALGEPEDRPGRHAAEQQRIQSILEEAERSRPELDSRSWFVMDQSGMQWGRTPRSETTGKNWAFRDYFHGLGRDLSPSPPLAAPKPISSPHRSTVFHSQSTGALTVAFSVPVFGEHHPISGRPQPTSQVLGVLGMTVALGRFGELHPAETGSDGRQLAILIDTHADWTGEKGLVLQHPVLKTAALRGQPAPVHRLQAPWIDQLEAQKKSDPVPPLLGTQYFDPVAGPGQGRWLAAAEPVLARGQDIGWVVIVEEPYSATISPVEQLGHRLLRIAALGLCGVAAVLMLVWGVVVRSLSRSGSARSPARFWSEQQPKK